MPVVSAELDSTLVVYIGAHPDDIDIGMSGSLYKYDAQIHPILWIVATDGGGDDGEYTFESSRKWLTADGFYNFSYPWTDPYGNNLQTRSFYSYDLSDKRNGLDGKFSHPQLLTYNSPDKNVFSTGYDWQQRVSLLVPGVIETHQMNYTDPSGQTHLYPDGGMGEHYQYPDGSISKNATEITIYTDSLAKGLAKEIDTVVTTHGYRKDLIYIKSHAPDIVAHNAYEHPDHEITGNAVLKTTDILNNQYGYSHINATWFTIYTPIMANEPYSAHPLDIKTVLNDKVDLCKAAWESEDLVFNKPTLFSSSDWPLSLIRPVNWFEYPLHPNNEWVVNVDYYPNNNQSAIHAPGMINPISILTGFYDKMKDDFRFQY